MEQLINKVIEFNEKRYIVLEAKWGTRWYTVICYPEGDTKEHYVKIKYRSPEGVNIVGQAKKKDLEKANETVTKVQRLRRENKSKKTHTWYDRHREYKKGDYVMVRIRGYYSPRAYEIVEFTNMGVRVREPNFSRTRIIHGGAVTEFKTKAEYEKKQ